MTNKQFNKLLKEHGGWIDGEFLRFSTPHALAQFEKAVAGTSKGEGL